MGATLAAAVLVAAQALPPPSQVKTDEEARARYTDFLPVLAASVAAATEELTCEGFWAQDPECRRKWPGPAAELAGLELTIGWWESKLDPQIQTGQCYVWGPAPNQITCDGLLFRNGIRPPHLLGISHQTRWGLVVHTSVSVFQMKPSTQHRYEECAGLGEMSVFEASREAGRMLSGFRSSCRTSAWLPCTITSYAGSLTFRQAPARAATFNKVYANVRSALAS